MAEYNSNIMKESKHKYIDSYSDSFKDFMTIEKIPSIEKLLFRTEASMTPAGLIFGGVNNGC